MWQFGYTHAWRHGHSAVKTSTRISSARWPRLVAMRSEVPPNRIPGPKGWKDEDDQKNSDCNRRHLALQEWWVVIVRATGRPVDRHRSWNSCAPSRCRSARGQDNYNKQNVHQQPYSYNDKESTHENDHR